jgi:DNA mismatch repair ATPase MutS
MPQIKEYYKDRIQTLDLDKTKLRNKLRTIGWIRLLVFILLLCALFVLIPKMLLAGLILSLCLVSVFLYLIKYYLKYRLKQQHVTALISNVEKELQAIDNDFTGFDSGEEFTDPNHPFSYDMDIFGEGSIFQYINRTISCEGKKHLAKLLQNETLDRSSIEENQLAIQELVTIQEKLQDFRAKGIIHYDREQDMELLTKWIVKKTFFNRGILIHILAKIMPSITLFSILLAVFVPSINTLPIILYLINLFIVGHYLKRTNEEHNLIGKQLNSLKKYASLMEILENNKFQSSALQSITQTLISNRSSAARSIHRLSKLVSAFDNRMNLLAALFLEGILLWDIQCMIRLEKWKLNEGSSFAEWIKALAKFDALASLATYAFNHPGYVYADINETPVIEARELGHVLIPKNERVCNDFKIQSVEDYIIITGANMAGKSTFLRTVATSMIIAMTGAPVCASAYRFHPMPVFSSMRTSDSLNKHESYFYAELKRLKEMLDRLREGEKLFIILDEILKGTNSQDKQKGSYAALEQIIRYGGTGIIATHDLELAKIENKHPKQIRNLCFEIEIDQAKISFDYKLKDGITTKMNASLLMQQMGIIN